MTLDAHSFELVHQKTVFFYNHPEKITVVYCTEKAGVLQRVTSAAHIHIFHHQLCADGHNADGNGFYTSPASAASHVFSLLAFFFSSLAARHPADGIRASHNQHCTAECRSRLLCRVQAFRFVLLDCICFRLELLSCCCQLFKIL